MAPPKGARKAPTVRPAIPLPHVKRQAAAAAAAAAAKNKTASQPESEVKGVTSPQQGSPSTTKSTINEIESPTAVLPNASAKSNVATANGHGLLAGEAKLSPLPHEKEMSVVSPKPTTAGPDLEVHGHAHRSQDYTDRTPKPTQPAAPVEAESRQEAPREHAAKPSVSVPAGQPMRQMPPAFQPANRPASGIGNGNLPPRPPIVNGHPHMHKPHPSSGSIHFGAFHDSAGSSPAPPHSGGVAPPPGVPGPNGRQSWMASGGNGYPPNMPPNLDMMAANNYDVYGRPDLAYSHMDPYGHYANSFPPSTPQSFHESSGSAHPDDAAQFHPIPSSTSRHPPPGFGEEGHHPGSGGRIPGMRYSIFGNPLGPWFYWEPTDPVPPSFDEGKRDFFGSEELADCTIEVHYRDRRIPPLRIPGHRMILMLSTPTLRDLVRKQQAQQSESAVLVLQADDDWVNSNSFHLALRHVYGYPLLDAPRPDAMVAGSTADRFRYALSYAASGRLLGAYSVVRRGCEIATQLLSNDMVEAAFEFAVHQYEDKGTHENLKWGDGSRVLLDGIIGYLFGNLPVDFTFDPSALGSAYTRLPYDVPSPAQSNREPTSPVIVRGNALGHQKGSLSQSQHIQFGDLSLTNGDRGQGSQQMSPAIQSAMSRVIVNLPFGYLRLLLEARFPGPLGADGKARLRIVQEVVKEREARRERAIQAIESGRVPDAPQIRASLSTMEPTYTGPWSILGWKEEISFSAGDGPVLRRQWIPLKDDSKVNTAAYP